MFQKLVTLIIMLALSIPFVSLAEQNSVEAEAETAAGRDAVVIMREIRTTAERDASQDTSKCLWFGIGVGAYMAVPVGIIGGLLVGESLASSGGSSGILYASINPEAIIGCLAGGAIGLAPVYGIYTHKSPPPPERLLGKSPEYAAAYTDAYMSKTRSIQRKWAGVGASVVSAALYLFLRWYD